MTSDNLKEKEKKKRKEYVIVGGKPLLPTSRPFRALGWLAHCLPSHSPGT
jgi:hypothetical protein